MTDGEEHRFRSVIEQARGGGAVAAIPGDVTAALGGLKQLLAPELEAALAAEPGLRQRFDALSFSRRRELADPIAEARKPETRAARLEKALARLRVLARLRELA